MYFYLEHLVCSVGLTPFLISGYVMLRKHLHGTGRTYWNPGGFGSSPGRAEGICFLVEFPYLQGPVQFKGITLEPTYS